MGHAKQLNDILYQLRPYQIKVIVRLLTGYCHLNKHEHLVKPTTQQTTMCNCNQDEETVEHYLLHCEQYQNQRHVLKENIKNIIHKHFDKYYPLDLFQFMTNDELNTQLLLLPMCLNSKIGAEVVNETYKYVKATRRTL